MVTNILSKSVYKALYTINILGMQNNNVGYLLAAVEEVNLNHYIWETILITLYTYEPWIKNLQYIPK